VQFIDQANIILKAGKGGNGIVSFRREKFVPAGGPSGGNGGRGGSVILMADNNLQTLLDFKFKREIIAEDGCKGGPNKRSGASGQDTILKVPCGTEIRDINTGIILGDLTKHKQSLIIAIGGRGGHGNAYYLSNQNRAPESFTEGKDGEIWEVQLELKLLAEVGIIGLPNAGKSTLISVVSSARPKIANYPFTTLIPNLGVVRNIDGNGCLFADIPGLISGANASYISLTDASGDVMTITLGQYLGKVKLIDLRLTEAIFLKEDKSYIIIDFNNQIREADEY